LPKKKAQQNHSLFTADVVQRAFDLEEMEETTVE